MPHHKRRRRKKGGIKGHCHMCSLATTDGRRNGRTLTVQEQAARVSEREQTEAQRRNAACDELTELLGPPPDVYLKSTDWAPSSGPVGPKQVWPDSLPVVDFDGSDEALERGQIEKAPPSVSQAGEPVYSLFSRFCVARKP